MIRFNNKDIFDIESALKNANLALTFDAEGGVISCTDPVAAQAIIDALPEPMPDLTPRQFKYMLAASGIYPTMDAVSLVLQSMSLELYAQVVSQLDGGTVYFWQKSLDLCNQLKPLILQQNPNLNLDEANLRVLWTLASLN